MWSQIRNVISWQGYVWPTNGRSFVRFSGRRLLLFVISVNFPDAISFSAFVMRDRTSRMRTVNDAAHTRWAEKDKRHTIIIQINELTFCEVEVPQTVLWRPLVVQSRKINNWRQDWFLHVRHSQSLHIALESWRGRFSSNTLVITLHLWSFYS